MNREFLELYNRELRILKENAKEFAEQFPGVAERLGGLIDDNMDPMIEGLLEGSAFLASRVQLKLNHEYAEFTSNLLEQLVPDYLAPIPSAALLRVESPYGDPSLKDGVKISAGSYAEARFVERERRIACKYRLASDVTLWPFEIAGAEFLPSPASLHGLGIEAPPAIQSGLKLTLQRRVSARREDEPDDKQTAKKPETWISKLRARELPFHIVCQEADAVRLYEKLFGHTQEIYIRHLNSFGDPVVTQLPISELQQIGFEEGEALFPEQGRNFGGFDLLREYFVFPTKFLGFRIGNLQTALAGIDTTRMEIVFAFDQADARLGSVVRAESFAMYAAPAINLFEMTTARVPLKKSEHEHHVVTDRSRHLDFEAHRILKVYAHYAGRSEKTEVYPLYAAPPLDVSDANTMYYTVRRLPRRRSSDEQRYGQPTRYAGTDMFMTLSNNLGDSSERVVSDLSIRALCSNRHLTEHLPVGQGGADFILEERTNLKVSCIAGPTLPRDAVAADARSGSDQTTASSAAWRLISMLSLNHLGLTGRGTSDSGAALREIMSLFANLADAATERRVRGVVSVESRPINRRIRQQNGAGVARGLEVKITLDEKAFEGSGIFLLGAVLDRFLAEYVGINNIMQAVIASTERGVVMRWPVRLGKRAQL